MLGPVLRLGHSHGLGRYNCKVDEVAQDQGNYHNERKDCRPQEDVPEIHARDTARSQLAENFEVDNTYFGEEVFKLRGELDVKNVGDCTQDLTPGKYDLEHDLQALLALHRHALLEQEPDHQKDGKNYPKVHTDLAQGLVALIALVADALPIPTRPVVTNQAVGPSVVLGANLLLLTTRA